MTYIYFIYLLVKYILSILLEMGIFSAKKMEQVILDYSILLSLFGRESTITS